MKKFSIAAILLLSMVIHGFSQNELWDKAVSKWEEYKTMKPSYCLHVIDAGAKGYASDYNTATGNVEGPMLYQPDGTYKINVIKFKNKGETYEVEGNPTKDAYNDLMHIKENLIFAHSNQQYLTIEPQKDAKDNVIRGGFVVTATIPDYEAFSVTVNLNPDNGMPQKVVNSKAKSSKNADAIAEITVLYKEIDGKLLAEQYIEKSKIEFFGNAVYQLDAFIFSQFE
jgi:hypothetical protein